MDFDPHDTWPGVPAGSDQPLPILPDPDHRADDDAILQGLGEGTPSPSIAGQGGGIDEAERHRDEHGREALDLFASLVQDDRRGDASSIQSSGSHRRPSRWKRRLVQIAFLAAHLTLFGVFYLFVLGPRSEMRRDSVVLPDDPFANARDGKPRPPAGVPLVARVRTVPPVEMRAAQPEPAPEPSPLAEMRAAQPELALEPGPPFENQAAQPEPAPEPDARRQKSPARKAPDRAGPTGRRRARVSSSDPPGRVEVRPAFFVPREGVEPKGEQRRRLAEHLDWGRKRYGEMLRDRDTFTLADGPALIQRSRTSLADLRAAPEMGAPLIAGELLTAVGVTRFNGPYVFVIVVMNPRDDFPVGGGRPFNGGFNTGGGIVVLSSFALDRVPNFQSTLEHELGHAFGLPHVDTYGHDMKTRASIMSYNPSHHTRGMRPSPTPGTLVPEDLRGFWLNHRAFPKLTFLPARDVPAGYSLAPVVPLGPMTIDGQPPYQVEVTTDSGETFGSRVSNIVQNRIRPDRGGNYDRESMWQSRPSPDGWSVVRVRFPVPVTLTRIGVHSEHSGSFNAADGVRVRAYARDGAALLAESPLNATDTVVPLLEPTTAQAWEIEFHAANNKEVTIRGLRFFTRTGEIFPPLIPPESEPAGSD